MSFFNNNKTIEVNLLDTILTSDCCQQNALHNDAHAENLRNEWRTAKNIGDTKVWSEPTSVTLLDRLSGKKHCQIVYEGLRVLLDTGSSDSLVRKDWESNKLKKYLFHRWGEHYHPYSEYHVLQYLNLVIKR